MMEEDKKEKEKREQSQIDYQQLLPRDFQAIIAGFFPNTRYFDSRFDLLQVQIDELRRGQESLKDEIKYRFADVDRRFGEIDRRFVEIDRRFGEIDRRFVEMDKRLDEFKKDVDKRFEQVDRRFGEVISSINRLADNLENRDKDQRNFTLRMFSISIVISIIGALGAFLKTMGVF
jgi:chromosome segregation ATPase